MPFLSGKQAFLRILKQEGVEFMFGNPGTTELPLMDGLAREPGIRYILALQESVAIAMADGYAQASGKLAAVNVHTSPGLGNAMYIAVSERDVFVMQNLVFLYAVVFVLLNILVDIIIAWLDPRIRLR